MRVLWMLLLGGCGGLVALGAGPGDTDPAFGDDPADTDGLAGVDTAGGVDSAGPADTGSADTGTPSDTGDTGGADTGTPSDTGDSGEPSGRATAAGGGVIVAEVFEGDAGERRYVALYNAGLASVDLTGWSLVRYANGQTTGTPIALSGTVSSGETHVVCHGGADTTSWFATTFGQAPEQTSLAIQHNGDDAYELIAIGSVVVDAYGVKGQQPAPGVDWEGKDAVWIRAPQVTQGRAAWTASEWTRFDDLTQAAPYGP